MLRRSTGRWWWGCSASDVTSPHKTQRARMRPVRHGYRSDAAAAKRPSGRRRLRRRARMRRRLLLGLGLAAVLLSFGAVLWGSTLPHSGFSTSAAVPSPSADGGARSSEVPPASPSPLEITASAAPSASVAPPLPGSPPSTVAATPGTAQAPRVPGLQQTAAAAPAASPAAAPGPSTSPATSPAPEAAASPTATPSKCSPLFSLGGLLGGKPCP